jgi:PIN domain-containing protein
VRLLLDENVPQPLNSTIKTLLRSTHDIRHVIDLEGWSGTNDLSLYDQARAADFHAILTNDRRQMYRRQEVEAIAQSGVHRIQYPHRQMGLAGVGLAIATVCAALPAVLDELTSTPGQRLVTLKGIDPARKHRYVMRDPNSDPPPLWPTTPRRTDRV